MKKITLLAIVSLLMLFSAAYGDTSFVVKKIEVNGLQRIPQATLYSYLPIKTGQTLDDSESNKIINDLYATGFFSNISLSRQNNTLIINVVERPVINNVKISGNSAIKTKQLNQALTDLNVIQGAEYNPFLLADIKNALLPQYYSQGRYNAKININVIKLARNRVNLAIDISEGKVATIKQVNIVGNYAFPEKTLQDHFSLTSPGLLSLFNHSDIYSKEKFSAALNGLKNFYLDHGYLRYSLNSSQVSTTPNREQIYINVNITEGEQYRISNYQFTGNTSLLSTKELNSANQLRKGAIFSRQKLINTERNITNILKNRGYAYAEVILGDGKQDSGVTIDDKNRTVALTLSIKPGERVYVRRVTFSDNYHTNDNVLRRQIEQLEGALSSYKLISTSKQRLLQLPYIRGVDVQTTPVPGKPNEEDVNYKVKEYPSASFSAGLGYNDAYGPLFNAAFNQKNFLGTGNQFGVNFQRATYLTQYAVNYNNPYYTNSGIGRGFNFDYQKYNASQINITDYTTNTLSANMYYSIPISTRTSYQIGYGYENLSLKLGSTPSTETQSFVDSFGTRFYQLVANLGWNYRNFDRAIMPTKGTSQSLGLSITAPISKNKSLSYYRALYALKFFQPLYKRSWLFTARGNLGYANGYGRFSSKLPFFENFYAGGMDSVRGYVANTLGPQDSQGNSIGGNVLIDGSAGVVFPNPAGHNIRTTWFVDGGNVFNSPRRLSGIVGKQFRYSTGVEVDWLSPFGATLRFALAQALNASSSDQKQFFSFSLGAGI
ncbi:MAG: outer membrane protein assembly factor BamA [Pseudomonadota bacterium]